METMLAREGSKDGRLGYEASDDVSHDSQSRTVLGYSTAKSRKQSNLLELPLARSIAETVFQHPLLAHSGQLSAELWMGGAVS
jgi:hypothetical protein